MARRTQKAVTRKAATTRARRTTTRKKTGVVRAKAAKPDGLLGDKHVRAVIEASIRDLELSQFTELVHDPNLERKLARATKGADVAEIVASLEAQLRHCETAYEKASRSLDEIVEKAMRKRAETPPAARSRAAPRSRLARELAAAGGEKDLAALLALLKVKLGRAEDVIGGATRSRRGGVAKTGTGRKGTPPVPSGKGINDDIHDLYELGKIIGEILGGYIESCNQEDVVDCEHVVVTGPATLHSWDTTSDALLDLSRIGDAEFDADFSYYQLFEYTPNCFWYQLDLRDPSVWWTTGCVPAWLGAAREVYFELPPAPCDGVLRWQTTLLPYISQVRNLCPTPQSTFMSVFPFVREDIETDPAPSIALHLLFPTPYGNLSSYICPGNETKWPGGGPPKPLSGVFDVKQGQVARIHFLCTVYTSAMGGLFRSGGGFQFFDPKQGDAELSSPDGLRYEFSVI